MRKLLTYIFLLCSIAAFAQPTLQDTTRFTVFDPVKQWDATGAELKAFIGTGSGDITNGGNTTGATVTIGTNDANVLSLETNNVTRASITGGASTGGALTLTDVTANTATVEDAVTIQTNSSGTAAAGFGGAIKFQGESSTTNSQDMARISSIWTTATHASRTSDLVFSGVNSAGSIGEVARFTSGTAPVLKIASAMGTTGTTTYRNGGITTGTTYTLGGSVYGTIIGGSSGYITLSSSSTSGMTINATSTLPVNKISLASGTTFDNTSGNSAYLSGLFNWTVSSGTGNFAAYSYTGTINQSGTATGAFSGLTVNPTITNAIDFRGVNLPYSNANAYGIYQSGASTKNVFVGKTAFGSTSAPTALVHLAAGTTTVSPLKFTSGTNLTAAEAGAVEYDGTELYFSPSTTRYKVAQVRTGGSTIESGTYTPTRSGESNLDANVTMTDAQYMRVGNTVTVSGRFTADPTTATNATSFQITLPIASNLGAAEDCAGVAFSGAASGMGAAVFGVSANDTAIISWIASGVTSQTWSYTFTYEIL